MLGGRKLRRLEKRRNETLSVIRGERLAFEEMLQRPRKADDELPGDGFVESVRERFAEIEQKAQQETDIDELDSLGDDAEQQGHLRAYLCPREEIRTEACLAIDLIEEWHVPRATRAKLQRCVDEQMKKSATDPATARGALRAVFKENDSWREYTSDYADEMRRFTRWWLALPTFILLLGAVYLLRFPFAILPSALPVLFAGAAGSCVSVMTRMPVLEVSLSGELASYERRILSRVATGVIASVTGAGLLAWGLISFSIHGQSFPEILNACSTASCTALNTLIILAVSMLFGFSERALTSFEAKVFGNSGKK